MENAMTFPRRTFLHLAAGATALPAILQFARAQGFPSRPVRMLVGFSAGATGDVIARLMGQWLSERLGQPFIIENRPGAGSNIATEAAVRAPPDGHTLLYFTPASAVNATLYHKLKFDFLRDIAPIARIGHQPDVMVVNPSVPVRTVPEFIAYAKANPGKINMASSGIGNTPHMAGELFNMMAGVNMVHVPYRGEAPALTDLLGGGMQVMFSTMPSSIEHIRAGKLRPLAVTTATRSETLPDLPSVGEFVPDYEVSSWQGIGAPSETPGEIIDKLNTELNAALIDPKIKARLADLGNTVLPGSPADFGKFIAGETEKWAKVVNFAGLRQE
jgi:tripartite-type tricarboxylate transporter receptor subunit TctC